jgi:hypothetical protein
MYTTLALTPTDAEKISQSIYYLDPDNAMLWENLVQLPAAAAAANLPAQTWADFKTAIMTLYPGSNSDRLYTTRDLERLAYDYALKGVYTRADLGEYYRDFTRISEYLRTNQRIDDATVDRLFIQGFGEATRRRIEQRLAITQPTLHPDDPYPVNHVKEAATFLLASTNPLAPPKPPIASSPVPGISNVSAIVKSEPLDMNTLGTLLLNMQTQISQLAANQNVAKTTSTSPYQTNTNPGRPRPNGCLFCGGPTCRITACPRAEEFLRTGKCIRNAEGRIVLPNGRYVPGYIQGANLGDRVDRWHTENPGSLATGIPTISTSIYESVAEDIALQEAIADTEEEDDSEMAVFARVFANQLAKSAEKKNKKPAAGRAPPIVEIPVRNEKPAYKPTPVHKPLPENANPKPAHKDPQYHFLSPAENPALIQTVLDRALDVQIPVTTRELLAVSQDVRRRIKDHTTTKKVAATSSEQICANETNETFISGINDDIQDLVVAKDAAPLRSIEGVLDGKIKVDILLDSGSSIVAIRKNIWEQLGTPIRSDLVMNMESSHSTIETTVGVLKNFPVTIGPCTFYLQVQVSENLPCDVMMGRPFFMLTRAVTMDHPDGSQDLVLHDPNTGEEITLPTHQRSRKKKSGVQDTGF